MVQVKTNGSELTTCMIVEDEPAIRRLVSVVLQDMGCDTLAAGDAETALRMLKTERPDVILTDVRLPGISGVELTQQIKADESLADTPVLLMSAYGEPNGHKGDGFLAKPFDIDTLAEFVNPYIDSNP